MSLDAPALYDFYETVCALDVPIFVHPALAPIGYDLLQDYDLPRVLGREVDLTVATTRIIAGGVLDRFPNLKFVIAHFGGGIAAVKDRLSAKGYRFGTLKRAFAEYFDMLYFDLAGFELETFDRFPKCIGVVRDGCIALLVPGADGLQILGTPGWRMGEAIGVLVEKQGRQVFQNKGEFLEATPERLEILRRFREDLRTLLAERTSITD